MKQINKKLVSWASTLEDEALNQAVITSRLPFIHGHIALMPDAHYGMGSTVGSVIPTLGAVVPSAVGVDVGCFSGDTRVPLLDGTQKTLEEMTKSGNSYWVYSLDANGKIVPGLAKALKTRKDAALMKVVVSGGDEIVCTPDHKFMMNDGTYKEAQYLKFNDSLMPLYRKWQTRDGYESVSTGKRNSKQTHVLVYEAVNGPVPSGMVVHHKNHIHFDNRPENLQLLDFAAHSLYHRTVGRKFDNSSPEFQELRLAGMVRRMQDPVKRAAMKAVGVKNITQYMSERPDHFRQAVADNGKRGAKYLLGFNTGSRPCDECGVIAKNPTALRWHKKREHTLANHKVIATEHLTKRADVYCLQVPEYNNFALAAGVFVHNCGMIAVKTQLTKDDLAGKDLSVLRHSIERSIPLSAGNGNRVITPSAQQRIDELEAKGKKDYMRFANWKSQLGSLGSGNHFIEVSLDESDSVWLFLHSGSRGVGNKIAQHHIKIAQALCKRWFIQLEDPDLAYLIDHTEEFDDYIQDLLWAQDFALANREEMMDRVVKDLSYFVKTEIQELERINCHHNFTKQEHHFGKDVWLTRKGAIEASEGKPGLIPGSMGTRSYIVEGKGFKPSFNSAPHGAGRAYSRTKARETFTFDDLKKAMEGIEFRQEKVLIDEIPQAYKSIDQVMDDAKDLVAIKHTLRQILNVKGD